MRAMIPSSRVGEGWGSSPELECLLGGSVVSRFDGWKAVYSLRRILRLDGGTDEVCEMVE
jgi:hypothetical protein